MIILNLNQSVSFANSQTQDEKNSVPQSTMFDAGGTNNLCTAGTKGLIVADDRQAAALGVEILNKGGNAIDAAVETAFSMAVTRPQYSALGGGGFIVYCPAPLLNRNHQLIKTECKVIDFREVAPALASKTMFMTAANKPNSDLSQNGALASAVPGMTAGLLFALNKFGSQKFSTAQILKKPILLAKNGVVVSTNTELAAVKRWDKMNPEAKRIFSCNGKSIKPCNVGQLLKQPDLAQVLSEISAHGTAGFYNGWVAKKLVQGLKKSGGILSLADLKNYIPQLRTSIQGQLNGLEVVSMPLPSSGGIALLQILEYMNIANQKNLLKNGYGSVESVHALTHAMSLAFADRAEFLGDADFINVNTKGLLNPSYLTQRWNSTFIADHANLPIGAGKIDASNGDKHTETTHLSIIDKWGNAVAMTLTLNDNFGSAFVPEGTGVVMNNIMDDFVIAPGVPNQFGLIGSNENNTIAPGKKPLSSMTPTIIRDQQGNNLMVLGAAGGPRIISSVSQIIINRLIYNNTLADSLYLGRIHQQWMPDVLKVEKNSMNNITKEQLSKMGYKVEELYKIATAHALERNPQSGRVCGVADTRGEGSVVAEHE